MRRALALLLFSALLCAPGARAQDESDKDSVFGTQNPAVVGWRAPAPPPAGPPPLVHSGALLESARNVLAGEPEGKAKTDLLGALNDLDAAASKLPPEQRQGFIDGHLGDFNEVLRTLSSNAPGSTVRAATRAAARLNAGAERWEDAREFSEKALAFDPNDAEALIDRSRANTGLADFARGYADAERASKLAPNSADALTARAAAAYGLGNYLQAIADGKRALELDPENKNAFQLLKLSEGRTKKIPDFERSAPPQLADTVEREYHGMVEQLNQVEEMRQRPVEEPGPSAVQRFVSSSGSKLAVKDYWGAVEDADAALKLDPNNARALYFRATAHNLIGEYGDAAGDATRGLTITPNDSALHDARAWAYNRMGRFVDAIADAHWALESDPRDGYALANRAYADEQRGDYDAMAEDYKAAAALNPQFADTYADAARRHGLTPETAPRDKRAPLGSQQRRQAKSFALVIFSSLMGGLLIALGILHVSSKVKEASAPSEPPSPLAVARGIEAAYALGEPIGQGGMGVVYEATDRQLKRPVAIKMLRDEFKLDDAAKDSFLQEARTVAELHHPSIVDIHNIIEDERGLYLVFERLEGRTLDAVIAEHQRLPLSEIKRVLRAVCEALEYAHEHDVVHRDLKPGNVMLTKDGGIKVLDFGISRHAARAGARMTTTQTVVGTPHYMAPEQEYGIVQKENDVFSLGAVLYEMVTGVRPYEGSHSAKLAKGYIRASTRVPNVPQALDALIERSLEPDPEKRIKSPAEFWRLLDAVPDFSASATA
jgi:tetratricopeptide (TPR) repeat protein